MSFFESVGVETEGRGGVLTLFGSTADDVTVFVDISVIATAAINNAFTAVFSAEVGSGITLAPRGTESDSSRLCSAGDSSDAREGMEAISPVSCDDVRRGALADLLAAGEACFRKVYRVKQTVRRNLPKPHCRVQTFKCYLRQL